MKASSKTACLPILCCNLISFFALWQMGEAAAHPLHYDSLSKQGVIARDFPLPKKIQSIAFHPRGRLLALSLHDGALLLWDSYEKKALSSISPESCSGKHFAFSPKGSYVFPRYRKNCRIIHAGKISSPVQIWQLSQEKGDFRLKPILLHRHKGRLLHIQIDQEERLLGSIAQDGVMKAWSLQNKALRHSLRVPASSSERPALLPYALGPLLRVAAVRHWQDYYMLLYGLNSKRNASKLLHRTEYPFHSRQRLFCFSPNGRYYFDGMRIRAIYEKTSSYIPLQLPSPLLSKDSPRLALFHPNGQSLVIVLRSAPCYGKTKRMSCVNTSILRFYNSLNGRELFSLYLPMTVDALSFHPSGEMLALVSGHHLLFLFFPSAKLS